MVSIRVACVLGLAAAQAPWSPALGDDRALELKLLLADAGLAYRGGSYARGEALAESALKALREAGRGSSPEAAEALHVLAAVDRRLGRHEQAEKRCQEALALREKSLGAEHPDVAASIELLASIREDQGKLCPMGIARRALEIREKTSADHPTELVPALLLVARHELACSGRRGAEKARELVERALAIQSEAKGADGISFEGFHALGEPELGEELLREMEEAATLALEVLREAAGPAHPGRGFTMARLAMLKGVRGRLREARELFQESIRLHASGLSDDDLCRAHDFAISHWEGIREEGKRLETAHMELCLVEMARRGGKAIEDCLARAAGERLEVLTALRRAQGKRDPLEVVVKGPLDRECELGELPAFEVALTNVDDDKRAFEFTRGGDYRSGRLERWRFDVVDVAENPLPPLPSPDSVHGGLMGFGRLEPGESWETTLEMSKYVDIASPGEHTVRIQYHDHLEIADQTLVDDLILSSSKPLRLVVKPRAVEATRAELDEAAAQVAGLDPREPLKVIAGHYGPWAHGFIAPDSPQGKLLALGWKAVPALLDEVAKEQIDPARRAWALSLLFAITGRNDPRLRPGVLGAHSWREAGWSLFGSKRGREVAGGLGLGGEGTASGGAPDPAAQRELLEAWRAWRAHLAVKVRP
ncbi:MAG: tetratricopeptide repeat protein [Planctomycetes bacterium]|nr:tetratricopeptide repeat protein [Planctomycetota bacterium]